MKILDTNFIFLCCFLETNLPSSGITPVGPVVVSAGPGSSPSTWAPVNLTEATKIMSKKRDSIFGVDSLACNEGRKLNRSPNVQAMPYRAVEIKAEGEAKICLQS